jgi:DNA-binding IclR family transcriptional regulator
VGTESAVRVLAVLRALAAAPTPQPAETLARSLGIPRASLYRLLRAMSDEGFVTHFPEERRWGLGIATLELGSAYLRADPLARLARPLLAELVDTTGGTVHLAVLHGNETLYLLVERPRRAELLVTDEGVRLPAHLTATGRAILAQLSPVQLRALYPRRLVLREEAGPRTLRDLRDELEEERARGWSSEQGLVSPGFASVAAAVFDASGFPTAAIGVTVGADADRSGLPPVVVRTSRALTRRLGGRAPRLR